jgi:hypothetical protein
MKTLSPRSQSACAGIKQRLGIAILKDFRSSLLRKLLQKIICLIGNPSGSAQTTYNFALIVGDREFVEGTHRPGDEYDDVTRTHEDYVSPLQTESGVDQHIASIARKPKV